MTDTTWNTSIDDGLAAAPSTSTPWDMPLPRQSATDRAGQAIQTVQYGPPLVLAYVTLILLQLRSRPGRLRMFSARTGCIVASVSTHSSLATPARAPIICRCGRATWTESRHSAVRMMLNAFFFCPTSLGGFLSPFGGPAASTAPWTHPLAQYSIA